MDPRVTPVENSAVAWPRQEEDHKRTLNILLRTGFIIPITITATVLMQLKAGHTSHAAHVAHNYHMTDQTNMPDFHVSLSTIEFCSDCQRKSLKFLIRDYFHRKSVSPCGGRDCKFILHCRCSHLLCRTSLIKCEE